MLQSYKIQLKVGKVVLWQNGFSNNLTAVILLFQIFFVTL